MKVIKGDNYDRERFNETVVAENLSEKEAKEMADRLNNDRRRSDEDWYTVHSDDYVPFVFAP